MAIPVSREQAEQCIKWVEEKLLEGGTRPGDPPSSGVRAHILAAREHGIDDKTLWSRIKPGGPCDRLYGLKVDWRLYKAKPAPIKMAQEAPEKPVEPVIVRRLSDKASAAEARAAEAERRLISHEGLRDAVFRLASEPLKPPSWNPPKTVGKEKRGEALILFLSDAHMGEVISLDQMGGRNSYDKAIARRRIERLFQSVVSLATTHWSGPPPSVIYVIFGGDLVSGEIHDELAKTNDLLAIPAVREVSECLVSGLNLLLKTFTCPINVISVPGNHGRTTRKPESKAFAVDSYDTLIAWCVESHFSAKAEKRISFSAPASGDALVNIFGWNVLFSHGDRIGSRGGAGFVGPSATAARGFQKLIMDYAADGTTLDLIVIGHFHTSMELPQGFVNGSLPGPSEYSRTNRMRPEPASQWLLSIDAKHGVTRRWKVLVGHESEGTIYKGRS
jgi:hypothetical protein